MTDNERIAELLGQLEPEYQAMALEYALHLLLERKGARKHE